MKALSSHCFVTQSSLPTNPRAIPRGDAEVMPFRKNPVGADHRSLRKPGLLFQDRCVPRLSVHPFKPHGLEVGSPDKRLMAATGCSNFYRRAAPRWSRSEHQPGGPDFERRGVPAVVGVTDLGSNAAATSARSACGRHAC